MKSVLITGGTGSFGRAFAQYLLGMKNGPSRVAVYSRGEHAQEEMARSLADDRMRYFIGDVRDKDRLEMAMRGVDTVIHAAALKIVPTAEYNPTECVATNVGGAQNVIKASLRTGVKRVVALSTDKAVNPINLYGASKLCAEKIFIAANALAAGHCEYSVVRYGNVAGSRGSVIPLFKKIAATEEKIPITDIEMTRFHIGMDGAINLVMQALGRETGGEILIPKIPSFRVVDLAEAIAPSRPWNIIGIRPGEKIHETLITEDESRYACDMGTYYIIDMDTPPNNSPFRYASDSNKEWLDVEKLRQII